MLPLELDASITSLAPGGDGVAHVELEGERRAVFVPDTAPGDRRAAGGRPLATAGAWTHRRAGLRGRRSREPRVPVVGAMRRVRLDAPVRPRRRRGPTSSTCARRCRRRGATEIASSPAPRPLGYRTRARVHVRSLRSGRSWSACTRRGPTSRSRSRPARCSIPPSRRSARAGSRCSRGLAVTATCRSRSARSAAGARGALGRRARLPRHSRGSSRRDRWTDRGRASCFRARRGRRASATRRPG